MEVQICWENNLERQVVCVCVCVCVCGGRGGGGGGRGGGAWKLVPGTGLLV